MSIPGRKELIRRISKGFDTHEEKYSVDEKNDKNDHTQALN